MNRCEQCGKSIEGFHVVLAYDTGDKRFCDPKCVDLYNVFRERSDKLSTGNKRDLNADLELCNRATPGPWKSFRDTFEPAVYTKEPDGCRGQCIVRMFGLYTEHTKANAEFIAQSREGWPYALERALEAEALARELAEVLLLYRKWEADLRMDNSLWQSASGLPFITQEVWDELVAVQVERNKVLHKAKEVLGDE